MASENISMKMETSSRVPITLSQVTITKTKNEVLENIIFTKVESFILSLIHFLPKYQKYNFRMGQSILASKKTELDRALVKLHMLMAAFMMDNGKMTKKMEMDNFSTLMELNIKVNGKEI